jgi:hypothetical protein
MCISVDAIILSHLKCIFDDDDFAGLVAYPDEILALGLMSALQSEEIPWALHVATMPKTLNSTIFWDEEELELLKPSTIYHLTKLMNRQIAQDWTSIHEPISKKFPQYLCNATIDTYKWALAIIYSRAVGFTNSDGRYIRCIPPVIDMANHNPSEAADAADTFRYNEVSACLQLLSCRQRNAGEECYAVYGTYPNSKLVYSYGFILPGNPHRCIDLWTRVGPSTQMAERKQEILVSRDLTRDQPYDFTGTIRPGWISPALLDEMS